MVCLLDVFFDFLGTATNGMIGFRTKNDKVVFSLDFFFNFFGIARNEIIGF